MAHRQKIVVAMSGGVDSSVAAALLVEQGFDVQGVSLRMWEGNAGPRVCSDHRGAEEIAARLNIPHTLIDLRAQFADRVLKPFAGDYLRGRTPNPCVACNRDFKLGMLLDWAREQGAEAVATGHYARIVPADRGARALLRGLDRAKDQSYFLFALTASQLAQTVFPLGGMHKDEVRGRARRLELAAAERAESQDIYFGNYKELVAAHADRDTLPGDIVDRSGRVLGRHSGVHGVTIGQRRGLGIAASEPLYVLDIDASSRRTVVGKREELGAAGMVLDGLTWHEQPCSADAEVEVQIRYRAPAAPCVLGRSAGNRLEVWFKVPQAAVTPGQAAVFYRGDKVLGGGWIHSAIRH